MKYEDVPDEFNIATHFVDRNDDERTALITDSGPVGYGALKVLVNRVGGALRELGVGQGDRVLLALADGVEFVATWFGAQKIGAVTAEVYTFLRAEDYKYFVDYATPAVVVADATTLPRLRAAGVARMLVVGVPQEDLLDGESHFDTLVAARPDTLTAAPTRSADPAMWRFTTGSTGAPKACVLPARSALLSTDWYAFGSLGLRPDDVVLSVPKLFFGYANNMTVLFPFGAGATGIVSPARATPELIFELIRLHRPTILVNVPTMISAMVRHPDAAAQDLGSLRVCVSGGEVLPAALRAEWMDLFGVEVLDGIGSSEAFHGYICNRPGRVRPGSLGEAVPGYRLRVVDRDGTPVPDGEVGQLEITGETVALQYWQAPEKSAETFPRPHTVRSSDLVVRSPDGYFTYQGRADDLLKVGGMWVAPAEIERCLLRHPAVRECAVVGYEVDGLTKTRAFVVADTAVAEDAATATALQEFVRSALAPHKYPRDVRFVATLPLTPSGKVDRQALRAL
ncbi:benzoate-CoA ligase [Actinokineospora diospyrosa]|uniref:Benzoate-CoA ligase n=2 Tax=Actinokineospora diospyrosa TaxID=103728 RepID=A0ABT1IEB8_9PSEU|nr:benzoate-CoA ligase [Actinokineospora diospyrosa]